MENFENIRLPWRDWKIVKDLGGGAYGRVYEIERTISGMQEKAALKIVSRPKNEEEIESYYNEGYSKADLIASYESEIQNYVQEYKLMKELQGESNIVSCDDFTMVPHEDGIGGDIFIRMELLTSLQQILRERSLSEQEIIKFGKDISHALVLCESKNIIHRDIKPANIMVSQFGNYKLGDFGVSKIMDHATFATAMGTPEYQAPEVVHMERYGQAADIYSLGITLYWLLNNRRMPFIDANQQITLAVKNEAMDRRYRGEKLPVPKNGSKRLKEIVLKACEYKPEDRYASAQAMYDELDALKAGNTQTGNVPKKNKTVTMADRFQESGTIQGGVSDDNWNDNRATQGNSWGGATGTIGAPGGKKEKNKKVNGYQEEPVTATVGVKNPKLKAEEHRTRSGAYYTVKKDEIKALEEIGWIDAGNSFVIIICLGFGLVLVGAYLFIPLVVVGFCIMCTAENWNNKIGFKKWLKEAKKVVPDLDQRIMKDTEFAKSVGSARIAYDSKMMKYITRLNPEAGKELQNLAEKKK